MFFVWATDWVKRFVLLAILAAGSALPVVIWSADAQQGTNREGFVVPEIDRIRVRDELQKHVSDLVEKAIMVAGLQGEPRPIVSLNITIDRDKIGADFETHQRRQSALEKQTAQQLWQDSTARFLEMMKAMRESEGAASREAVSGSRSAIQPAPRVGILNVAPEPTSENNGAIAPRQEQRIAPSFSFSAPTQNYQKVQFSYSLLDYVSNISIAIHVPAAFNAEARSTLQNEIVNLLNLKILNSQNAAELIKFTDLTEKQEKTKAENGQNGDAKKDNTWLSEFLNPKNQSLSGLFVSLAGLLGFFLIGVTVLLSGRKLASAVAGLAQAATQSKESGTKQEEEAAVAVPSAMVETASLVHEKSSRSKFSPDKEADLLSQTRNQISESLKEWCQKDPVTVGEVLIDLSAGGTGLATLNSLLLYSGYANLKPALELLPKSILRKLDESLNESWQDGAELLPGLEAAQLLLAGMIPRQTALLRFSYDTVPIRKLLLMLEPNSLKELSQELSNDEFGLIFKILPQSVAVSVTKALSTEKLKEVLNSLSGTSAGKEPDEALLKKIEAKRDAVSEQRNSDKERLIKGMLKTATPATESKILEFFGVDDLLMRFELLQQRFFSDDLKFVEPTLLRMIIDKEPLSRKANFLYFSEAAVRQSILDLYPKESKALEALLEELENIDKSAKRKSTAESDKLSINAHVSGKVSDICKSDENFRLELIRKIAQNMGAVLPAEITQLTAEQTESAA